MSEEELKAYLVKDKGDTSLQDRLKADKSHDDVAPITQLDTQEQYPPVGSARISATTHALLRWISLRRIGCITFFLCFKLFYLLAASQPPNLE